MIIIYLCELHLNRFYIQLRLTHSDKGVFLLDIDLEKVVVDPYSM